MKAAVSFYTAASFLTLQILQTINVIGSIILNSKKGIQAGYEQDTSTVVAQSSTLCTGCSEKQTSNAVNRFIYLFTPYDYNYNTRHYQQSRNKLRLRGMKISEVISSVNPYSFY